MILFLILFRKLSKIKEVEDIEFINGMFTWNNHRGGKHQIASHLDCFLISGDILQQDHYLQSFILPCLGSDHWPICL